MRSFKKILPYVICLLASLLIIKGLDLALYPCTYTRNDVHTISTEQKDVIILGTSNGKMNLDPDIMLEGTGLTGHNLCAGGQYPIDSYYLARLTIEKQNPKLIILEVDPSYYMEEKEPGNNYLLFYHEFPISRTKLSYFWDALKNMDFRSLLFPFYEYELSYEISHIGSNLSQKLKGEYDPDRLRNEIQMYHENGFIEKFPVDPHKLPVYDPELFYEEKLLPENMAYIDRLIRTCQEEGIDIIAVSTPLPGATLKRYEENYLAAWKYFGEYFNERNVPFYNFNREYFKAFSHDAEVFVDYDGHMNGDGARAFSRVFGQIVWGAQRQR